VVGDPAKENDDDEEKHHPGENQYWPLHQMFRHCHFLSNLREGLGPARQSSFDLGQISGFSRKRLRVIRCPHDHS
jgi:hypothetical protein